MKAWEVRAGTVGLHDVAPDEPHGGETVVRVTHVGLCGSDRPKLLRPDRYPLPPRWRPGHEIVGLGPDGRAVVVDPLVPCEACRDCAAGDTHLCPRLRRVGWDLPGGFAEQVVVPARNVRLLPPGTAPPAMTLADPAAVAVHGLRCAGIGAPGRLAVVGAGPIGRLSALWAQAHGWRVVTVHGGDHSPDAPVAVPVMSRSAESALEQDRFDLVVDAASGGDQAPLDLALRLVKDGGTVVVQNAYAPGVRLGTPLRDLFRRSIRLVGSFSYCRRPPGDLELGLELLRDHQDLVAEVIRDSQSFDLLDELDHPVRHVRTVLSVPSDRRP